MTPPRGPDHLTIEIDWPPQRWRPIAEDRYIAAVAREALNVVSTYGGAPEWKAATAQIIANCPEYHDHLREPLPDRLPLIWAGLTTARFLHPTAALELLPIEFRRDGPHNHLLVRIWQTETRPGLFYRAFAAQVCRLLTWSCAHGGAGYRLALENLLTAADAVYPPETWPEDTTDVGGLFIWAIRREAGQLLDNPLGRYRPAGLAPPEGQGKGDPPDAGDPQTAR